MMSSTSANPDQGGGSVPGCGWPWQPDTKATMPVSQSETEGTMMEHGRCTVEVTGVFVTIFNVVWLNIIPLMFYVFKVNPSQDTLIPLDKINLSC